MVSSLGNKETETVRRKEDRGRTVGRQSGWTLGLPFPATKQRADVEHPASRPARCADKTRRTAEGTGGAQVPDGALPLSHGIEVLDVGPSIKGQ